MAGQSSHNTGPDNTTFDNAEVGGRGFNASIASRLLMNPNKAGTSGVDRDHINRVIYEASKGSPYFENEIKKDQTISAKVAVMVKKAEVFSSISLVKETSLVSARISQLERDRDLTQTIVHVDMDAFYAAVEELERPDLKGKPMAVGGNDMLCTANYFARKFGVRSALPGYIAKKLCPELIIIPPDFSKYTRISQEIRKIFAKYDPDYVPMSLDEAYLNITAYLCSSQATIDPSYNTTSSSSSSCKSPDQVVEEIRQLIFTTTGLTASAGVAPNRFLAKVCSDMNKPNGQMRIPADTEAIATFLHDLRIRKVPGIGRVMEKILNGLEIDTCGDMKSQLVLLYKLFSETSFNFLLYTALGLGETSLKSTSSELQLDRKSISVERTFNTMSRYGEMQEKLNELSELLATDLDELDLKGRSVTLKLKMASFEIISRSKSSTQYISTASELFSVAKSLLHAEFSSRSTHGLDAGLKIRLMGLRLSDLKSSSKESSSSAGIARFFIKSGEVGGGGEDGHVAAAAKRNTSGIKMEVFHCFNCPETLFDVSDQEINDHIDICVARSQPNPSSSSTATVITASSSSSSTTTACAISSSSSNLSSINFNCPICNTLIPDINPTDLEKTNEHIDACINSS